MVDGVIIGVRACVSFDSRRRLAIADTAKGNASISQHGEVDILVWSAELKEICEVSQSMPGR
jgi:hypothetical protein